MEQQEQGVSEQTKYNKEWERLHSQAVGALSGPWDGAERIKALSDPLSLVTGYMELLHLFRKVLPFLEHDAPELGKAVRVRLEAIEQAMMVDKSND